MASLQQPTFQKLAAAALKSHAAPTWCKTTPDGFLAPSWTCYHKGDRVAVITYLPGRPACRSWTLHYDGQLARVVLGTSDNVWIYCPTFQLAKARATSLINAHL